MTPDSGLDYLALWDDAPSHAHREQVFRRLFDEFQRLQNITPQWREMAEYHRFCQIEQLVNEKRQHWDDRKAEAERRSVFSQSIDAALSSAYEAEKSERESAEAALCPAGLKILNIWKLAKIHPQLQTSGYRLVTTLEADNRFVGRGRMVDIWTGKADCFPAELWQPSPDNSTDGGMVYRVPDTEPWPTPPA